MLTKIKNSIPNTITCLNLLAGVTAIVFAFNFDALLCGLHGYQWAFICIGAAAIFDFCDGLAARLLHAYSDLGKQLDSLADLVSFGVAPAMLVYNVVTLAHHGAFTPWVLVALLIPAMGALRLARFNIDTRQTTSFIGMPIPAAAIFWIGFVAWIMQSGYPKDWVMAIIVAAISLYMVSNSPMFSLKFKNLNLIENLRRYLLILAAILLVALCGVPGLMWTIIVYIFLSAFKVTITRGEAADKDDDDDDDDDKE